MPVDSLHISSRESREAAADEAEWEREIEEELSERQEELSLEYQAKMADYKEVLEECKVKRAAFVSA